MVDILDIFDDLPEPDDEVVTPTAKQFLRQFYDWLESPTGYDDGSSEQPGRRAAPCLLAPAGLGPSRRRRRPLLAHAAR